MTLVAQPATGRARTMQLKAARRLTETEHAGLRLVFDAVVSTEEELCLVLGDLRRAAEKEAMVRRLRGLPPEGPYGRAYAMTRRCIEALSQARQETEPALGGGNG